LRLKKILLSPWISYLIRFSIGSIFLYAGMVKLLDPKAFAKVISQYDLIPEILLPQVAIGLPVLEVLAGFGLVFAIRGSLCVIFGLLTMFVFVLWYGILRHLEIDCGCFSQDELKSHASLWNAFYRDLVMIAAVVYLYISHKIRSGKKIGLFFINQNKKQMNGGY
jgi:uncharacterized membrane protein YphA (DoxX/SURF4 family)